MVAHISVPNDMNLMGVLPVLAILFGSDDAETICERLNTLEPQLAALLAEKIQNTVIDPTYPLESSVWQFNDPGSDISAVTEALKDIKGSAMYDLQTFLRLYSDTLPFIHTAYEELDFQSVLEFTPEDTAIVYESEPFENPAPQKEIGPGALIIPSVAVGSLVLLSSKLKNEGVGK